MYQVKENATVGEPTSLCALYWCILQGCGRFCCQFFHHFTNTILIMVGVYPCKREITSLSEPCMLLHTTKRVHALLAEDEVWVKRYRTGSTDIRDKQMILHPTFIHRWMFVWENLEKIVAISFEEEYIYTKIRKKEKVNRQPLRSKIQWIVLLWHWLLGPSLMVSHHQPLGIIPFFIPRVLYLLSPFLSQACSL